MTPATSSEAERYAGDLHAQLCVTRWFCVSACLAKSFTSCLRDFQGVEDMSSAASLARAGKPVM